MFPSCWKYIELICLCVHAEVCHCLIYSIQDIYCEKNRPEIPQSISDLGIWLMADKMRNPIIVGTNLFFLFVIINFDVLLLTRCHFSLGINTVFVLFFFQGRVRTQSVLLKPVYVGSKYEVVVHLLVQWLPNCLNNEVQIEEQTTYWFIMLWKIFHCNSELILNVWNLKGNIYRRNSLELQLVNPYLRRLLSPLSTLYMT